MTTPMPPAGDDGVRPSFIAIIDVDGTVAESVLAELTREGIAAYAEPLTEEPSVDSPSVDAPSVDPLSADAPITDGSPGETTADETVPHGASLRGAGMRIHVDRSRVPAARAIITSRLPQAGSRFLSPRETTTPSLTTQEVDEAWARLIRGWDPQTDTATDTDGASPRTGGSGLSQRLIRQHGPFSIAPGDPSDPGDGAGPIDPAPTRGADPRTPIGPRDYALDDDVLDDGDADRFIPPEPPPLPRPRHTMDVIGWSAAIGGPVLLVANQVLSWGSWLSGIGVAAFMGGFIVLVARMRTERDHDDPGAVV